MPEDELLGVPSNATLDRQPVKVANDETPSLDQQPRHFLEPGALSNETSGEGRPPNYSGH